MYSQFCILCTWTWTGSNIPTIRSHHGHTPYTQCRHSVIHTSYSLNKMMPITFFLFFSLDCITFIPMSHGLHAYDSSSSSSHWYEMAIKRERRKKYCWYHTLTCCYVNNVIITCAVAIFKMKPACTTIYMTYTQWIFNWSTW